MLLNKNENEKKTLFQNRAEWFLPKSKYKIIEPFHTPSFLKSQCVEMINHPELGGLSC